MDLLLGVVVGFVLGYGVRSLMSRYRRARTRREREHVGPWISINGAAGDNGSP